MRYTFNNNPMQLPLLKEEISVPEMQIKGLQYIPDYISKAQEEELIKIIDNQVWLNELKRRVQHYGYKYDYKAKKITEDLKLGNLPEWLEFYSKELHSKKLFSKIPDQVIINEYQAGQGITPHIDCVPCFGDTIASLSLGSACVMEFIHSKTSEKQSLLLEPRSMVILSDEARYDWKHSIPQRKTDKYHGKTFNRSRRISLTFRNVLIPKSSVV